MNNKIIASVLFVLALVWLFAPAPQVDAQTVSTANWAFPMPVTANTYTIQAACSSATGSLTGGVAVALSTLTNGTIPAGTKVLRVFAASGAYHYGPSNIGPDETGKFPHCAEDAYIDFPVNPISPNTNTLYLVNAASATGSLVRFIALR